MISSLVMVVVPALLNLRAWAADRGLAQQLRQQRLHPPSLPDVSHYPCISFLVAAWNEREMIQRCIQAVLELPYPNLELVLCAGGTDGTYALACQTSDDRRLILLEQQAGEGKQRALQRCLEASSGQVIYLTDADCVLSDESFLDCIIPIILKQASIVTGAYYLPPVEQFSKSFVMMQAAIRAHVAAHQPGLSQGLQGSNCVLERNILLQTGAFLHPVQTGTDYDLAKRLLDGGAQIHYRVQSSAQSPFPTTLKAYINQQARWLRNVVIHGLRYKSYGEVSSNLITSLIGFGMLIIPILIIVLIWATGGLNTVAILLSLTWGMFFFFTLFARFRYLWFSRKWLSFHYPWQIWAFVPLFILVDFVTWTIPLFEYPSKALSQRW